MTNRFSRRTVVARALAAAGAAAVAPVLERAGLVEEAAAAEPDLVIETLNGFVAFVVPGADP
jgi:hypothetical protein